MRFFRKKQEEEAEPEAEVNEVKKAKKKRKAITQDKKAVKAELIYKDSRGEVLKSVNGEKAIPAPESRRSLSALPHRKLPRIARRGFFR